MDFCSNKPRALITGMQGFTGQYLARELESAGYEVYGTTYHCKVSDASIFCLDLCDKVSVRECIRHIRPNIVAHLAAISFVAHGDASEIYTTNLIGSRYLLDALASLPDVPRSILFASSSNIYGNCDIDPIDESVAPNPVNDYAISKLAMEHMTRLWSDTLPITIARPFNYTGIGQSLNFLLPKIVDHFKRGEREIQLGNINVARDFSDVRSVCRVYRQLLEQSHAGAVFNVCSGVAFTLRQVLDMMAKIAGYPIKVIVNPSYVREKEVMRLRGSNARLREVCGDMAWIPLEQTLKWMFSVDTLG